MPDEESDTHIQDQEEPAPDDESRSDEEEERTNMAVKPTYNYQGQYDTFNDEVDDEQEHIDEAEEPQIGDEGAHLQESEEHEDEGAHLQGSDDEHEKEGAPTGTVRYNLRGKKINYAHKYANMQFTQVGEITPKKPAQQTGVDLHNHLVTTGFLFNQMTAKAGIKAFGDKAIEAIVQEFKQLDDKNAFKPRSKESLSVDERKRALRSITLVKEKRCGRIKGRTVADGRPQRDYIPQEESTSPTVSTEALMITIAIDAHERRDVATCDVEGAYLHADMDELVVMVVEGNMVEYLVQANPERYAPFVIYNRDGKKLLYVELLKALYGCVKSALLWFKLLSSTLMEMGFEINPYDQCVANKVINGKQCTICWYVDDLKISHVDKDVVTQVILDIERSYGKMTVTRGKKHTYVGMDIEYIFD
jgi:hypothetical protein